MLSVAATMSPRSPEGGDGHPGLVTARGSPPVLVLPQEVGGPALLTPFWVSVPIRALCRPPQGPTGRLLVGVVRPGPLWPPVSEQTDPLQAGALATGGVGWVLAFGPGLLRSSDPHHVPGTWAGQAGRTLLSSELTLPCSLSPASLPLFPSRLLPVR